MAQPATNSSKGRAGEAKVNSKLNPLVFGKVEHRLINDLILVDRNGKSHQIDHVEIRKNGIFCIETKNYSGLILGNANQDHWTQILSNQRHQLINPLKQNNSHIYHIRNVLGNRYSINSLIVMVKNNAEKFIIPNVINLNDLSHYLSVYNDGTNLSVEEMDAIYKKLLEAASEISEKEHIKNVKQAQRDLKKRFCPKCGFALTEKCGRYGKYFSCCNPKCGFKISEKKLNQIG